MRPIPAPRLLPPAPAPAAWRWLAALIALATLLLAAPAAALAAEPMELAELQVRRTDEGVLLDFSVRLELPRVVDEALHKGVPLNFVAEASLYRSRWYWRDARVARASRHWRLTWQPLTLNYRVGFGGLAQTYPTLADALAALRRSAGWRIAEPLARDDDASYYVEFGYRLDTSLLPRPMQIGIGGQAGWDLAVERDIGVPEAIGR